MRAMLINIVGFQLVWFALVLGGDWFVVAALAWCGWHLRSTADSVERKQMLIWGTVGLSIDQLLTFVGVLQFPELALPVLPLWFVGLWLAFPTVLKHSLRWVWSGHPALTVVGAMGAAVTYVGGARLAPLELPLGDLQSFMILTVTWLLFFSVVRRSAPKAIT